MEFDEIVVKEIPGLCRCCLSEGCYKDMGSEYTWMNENEVYADMLLECFDIGISQHNEGPNGPNRLICEVCITRLRDACNFKKQVLDSEKKFVDMIGRGEFRHKVLIYQSQMKVEAQEEADDAEVEYLEEDLGDYADEPAAQPEPQEAAPARRGRPRKTDKKPDKKRKLDERPKTSKAVVKETNPIDSTAEKQVKEDIARLLAVVIEHSSIMPFRWCGNKYMCFYCCCQFQDVASLRAHTHTEHENQKLLHVLKRNQATWNRLKLDVSQVACKLCPKSLHNLQEFLDHASSAHDLKFNREVSRSLFCVKLTDGEMTCLECDESFKFFGTLLSHGYRFHHNQNDFLCEVCGQGFVSKRHAANHHHYYHAEASCGKCSKKFNTKYHLKTHQEKEHKTFQCPKCPAVLGSRYLKKRHMAMVHDVKSAQFKCDECEKVFVLKNKLLEHKERIHLKLKPTVCPVCGFRVFNKDMLKRHMVRHDDARPFECDICTKAFQRKKTLEYHRRIHTSDKRHACKACGKAFVQVASLKLHMRVHHASAEPARWD